MSGIAGPSCLLRRTYAPARLLDEHPPVLSHPHKRLVFDLACPPGAEHSGTIEVTRWKTGPLPERGVAGSTEVAVSRGYYDYAGPDAGVWHVNFADPHLFVAYGSPLLAQDELQVAEHPLLGSVREALDAEGAALTVEDGRPTPVLVAGVERRCSLDTSRGLYGNRFAAASDVAVRAALRVLRPPTRSHLISMAAPYPGFGAYRLAEIETVLSTALAGFGAAVSESRRLWPETPVEVRTGFWGCGAFGGNRRAMVLLQALAARLAGVDRLRFHAAEGADEVRAGLADLERVVSSQPLAAILERVRDLEYLWGESDGN
jgi:hypothetical protein